jgi:hypothetical protein
MRVKRQLTFRIAMKIALTLQTTGKDLRTTLFNTGCSLELLILCFSLPSARITVMYHLDWPENLSFTVPRYALVEG